MAKQVKDGEQGGYQMICCGCGLVHRLDFDITPDDGIHLRVYRLDGYGAPDHPASV
jgi:hypothetical protein